MNRRPALFALICAGAGACAASAADPDTTTAASPARGNGPHVTVKSTVDGAALRRSHRARLAADHSAVTVLAGGTPLELGQRLCEQVVPQRPAATPVLIKPNLGGFDWFKDPKRTHGDDGVKGRITDPEFVRGIVRCLKARGHDHITIADGFTGKAADWQRLVKVSGYDAMARAEGVALVALDDDGVFDTTGSLPGKPLGITGMADTHVPTLLVPKLLAEHLDGGLYISAPKLKAHRFAVFSLGIKAMQGTTMYADASPAFHQKWRSHRELDRALAAIKQHAPDARARYVKALELFAERMVDILEVEAPDVELVEGAPAMGSDGFQHLVPTAENVAIGGTNVVVVDRVAAQYLGLWDNAELATQLGGHKTSPLLEVAAARFGLDLTAPALTGDGAKLLASPRPAHLVAMAGFELGAHVGELHATHVDTPPVIDGKLDDAWAKATPLAFATDWRGRAGQPPSRVRVLWSQRALYFLFELDDTGLHTDRARPIDRERIDLYEEDCVEIMVAPDPGNREHYYEIELGPYGHFFDLDVDRAHKRSDSAWSSHPRIATTQDPAHRRAVIEVAFEAPELVAALRGGAALPIGIYRMEGERPRRYLAAFPTHTAKPNFHVPSAFGTLVLDR